MSAEEEWNPEETPPFNGDFWEPGQEPPAGEEARSAVPHALESARKIALGLRQELKPACERIEIAGSIRRCKPLVRDIELVAISSQERREEQKDLFTRREWSELSVWHAIEALRAAGRAIPIAPGRTDLEADKHWQAKRCGARYLRLYLPRPRLKVDLFLCDRETWGAIFTIRTGSREYVRRLVTRWTELTGGGHVQNGRLVFPPRAWATSAALSTPEEEDVFRALAVQWVEPHLRTEAIRVVRQPCGHRTFTDACDDCLAWAAAAWRREDRG